MAISVVYTIKKKDQANTHDIFVHSDEHWVCGSLVKGGILDNLRKSYPESEFDIVVDCLIHPGNQDDE